MVDPSLPSTTCAFETVITPPNHEYPIDRSFISGLAYYDFHIARRAINKGDVLTLKREKENKHDPLAVEVFFCGRKLGYWPYPENKAIASLLDRDEKVSARVFRISDDKDDIYEALFAEAFVRVRSNRNESDGSQFRKGQRTEGLIH